MAWSRYLSNVIRKLPPSFSQLFFPLFWLHPPESSHQIVTRWPSGPLRSAELAKQPWQKQSFSFPITFIDAQSNALIGPAWVTRLFLTQSVISRMWFTDWLGQGHVLSCDAGRVGPAPFEPHHLGVRKEAAPKGDSKRRAGSWRGRNGKWPLCSGWWEREGPCFKSALLKYSLHPVRFTEF